MAASAWLTPAASDPLGVGPFTVPPLATPMSSGSGSDADTITAEIQALADGLQNDAARIYEYWRNHIEFEASWGCKKGATLTYLEGSGNAFDTSALMVVLLKASGYETSRTGTPARGFWITDDFRISGGVNGVVQLRLDMPDMATR